MGDGPQVFRPEALERLRSPEQLDELMVVTDSRGWIALAAMGFLLALALAWSVFGVLPTTVEGPGILLRRGGLFSIQAAGSGQVLSLLTAEDSVVEAGQVIGYIAQPDVATEIDLARQELEVLESRRRGEVAAQDRSLRITLDVLAQDSVRLVKEIESLETQVVWLRTRLQNTEYAQRQGLVTGETVEGVRQQLSSAESRASAARGQLTNIPNQRIGAEQEWDLRIASIEQEIRATRSRLELLSEQLSEANEIRSPYHGRVTELMVDEGHRIAAGAVVATVEPLEEPLQAMIFIPRVGAKARPGLTAHVQIFTVSWQEHGYLEGTVDHVSAGPVTVNRMDRVLKNDLLTSSLSAAGDPYLIEITLREADTPTGFRWTSGEGPRDAVVRSGILASAKIVVDAQRPITLVIPALRKFLGV